MSKIKPREEARPAQKAVKVTQGLAMIDPLTGVMYTSVPVEATPSAWVDTQLSLGHLVEA